MTVVTGGTEFGGIGNGTGGWGVARLRSPRPRERIPNGADELVTEWLETLAGLPFPLVLLVAWALAFAESGLGVGMLFPGETGVLILGTTATTLPRVVVMVAIVGVGVTAGDHVGFLLGRRYGARMRDTRVVRRLGVRHWDRAVGALRKYGAAAVFLTRLLPIVRTLTPAAAGSAGVRYARFLLASLAGGLLWGGLYVGGGALAGASVAYVEQVLGRASWGLFGALVVVVLGVVLWRRLRSRRTDVTVDQEESEPEPAPASRSD